MAKQRYINTRFWTDGYISNLDPIEKLIFLYCLTNQQTDISGVYEVPLKTIATDTGIDKEMVVKVLNRFENEGKIKYENGWIAVKNFIKHQSENPSILKGIEVSLEKCPAWCIDYIQPVHSLSHSNSNSNSNNNRNSNVERPDKYPLSFLQKIPKEEMQEIINIFKCDEQQVISKANSLIDYCKSKGKVYKNYKALLTNAIRKDFGERPPKKPVPIYDTSSGIAKIVGYK